MAVVAEPNSSSKVVSEAQSLLNKVLIKGKSPESGTLDKATIAAIKQFQSESGCNANGQLDTATMDLLRKAAKLDPPKYQVVSNGKIYLLSEKDYRALVTDIQAKYRVPMAKLKIALDEARFLWNEHKVLRSDAYIVSWFMEAAGRANFPSESVIKAAESASKSAESALSSGNLRDFSLVFPKAQKAVDTARVAMKTYCTKLVSGGDRMVTGLEFVSTASFTTATVIAAPVAVSFGMGAIAAGAVASGGAAAVETLSREVGNGIAGNSQGVGQAVKNTLLDTFIGGSVGAVVKGKVADKLLKALVPEITKQLGKGLFKKASMGATARFTLRYLQKNGQDILEGIIKETMSSFKSTSTPLTFSKFTTIVSREIVTAGAFGKLGKMGKVTGKDAYKMLSPKQRKDLILSLGKGAKNRDLKPIFEKIFDEAYKSFGSKGLDVVLDGLNGSESVDKIAEAIARQVVDDSNIIKKVAQEAEK